MKKLMLSLSLIAGLTVAASAQLKFGIKAGLHFPSLKVSGEELNPEEIEGLKANTTFYFGGTIEVPVNENFVVQSGLNYIRKGAKFDFSYSEGGDAVSLTTKINLNYLELPVNGLFKFNAGTGSLLVGAGAYYGYALDGNTKSEVSLTMDGQTEKESENEDLILGNTTADDFKRGDFGLNFLLGYELKNGLSFNGGYRLGLTNISNSPDGSVKNKGFSVGLGFNF